MADLCGHANEPSGSTKGGNFLTSCISPWGWLVN